MTAVQLWNLALLKIGVSQGIAATTEASREAYTAGMVYDHALRYVLRRWPGPFATAYASSVEEQRNPLLLVAGPLWDLDPDALTNVQAWDTAATYEPGDVVRDGGVNYTAIATSTASDPPSADWSAEAEDRPTGVNGDWLYAYRWPDDCLFARRLVRPGGDGRRGQLEDQQLRFRVGRDVNGLLLYTNEREAVLEYTAIDCDHLWTDDVWLEAFAWFLASLAAPTLAKNGLTGEQCRQACERELMIAATLQAREQQQAPDPAPDWIQNR